MARIRGPAPPFAIAAAIFGITFWLAWQNGGYGVVPRTAFALALWWGMAVCLAAGIRPPARPPREALIAAGLLLALGLWTLLSARWAPSAENAVLEFDRAALYLAVFALACIVSMRSTRGAWCDGLAASIAVIGICALASRFFPDLFSSRGLAEALPEARSRLSFPLGYWNGLAAFLVLGLPLLVRAAVLARSSVAAAVAVAPVPVLATGVYLASSRGAVAAAAAGTAALLAAADRRREVTVALAAGGAGAAIAIAGVSSKDAVVGGLANDAAVSEGRGAALFVLVGAAVAGSLFAFLRGRLVFQPSRRGARTIVVAVALVAVAGIALSHPVRRFEDFKRPPSEVSFDQGSFTGQHLLSGAGSGRWQFWSAAVDEWREHPLVGGGAGSFGSWWSAHGSFYYVIRDAHSLYVETLGELGLVGLILLIAFIAAAIGGGIRGLRSGDRLTGAALLGTAVAWLVAAGVDWMWELTAVSGVGIAALGLLAGSAPSRGSGAVLPGRLRWLGAAAALAFVLPLAVTLLTDHRLRSSEAAARDGDLERARARADGAATLEPWASSPRLQLALVDEELGRLRLARKEIDQAIRRDTGDWRLRVIAARLEAKLGDEAAARRRAAEARRLNPRSPSLSGSG